MRLRRVTISNFKRLQGPVLLDELHDGLTVIAGDNEEGKSTVLQALKAAFFEHHGVGGAVREAMQPYGGGTPSVEIAFELDGTTWTLRKAFKRGGIELTNGARSWPPEEAEQQLLSLLRFERRQGRSEQRPEHLGVTALFWLDQGTTFLVARRVEDEPLAIGSGRFGAAVASEIDVAAAGEGTARLLETVRTRCDRYWTTTWRESAVLKQDRETVTSLQGEEAAVRGRAQAQAEKVDRLERLVAERRRRAADDAPSRAQAKLVEARKRVEGLDALDGRLAQIGDQLKAREAEKSRLEALKRDRARVRADIAEAREAAVGLTDRQQTQVTIVAEQQCALQQAEAKETAAQDGLRLATDVREAAQQAVVTLRETHERVRLEASLGTVREAADAARLARAAIAGNRATAERLDAVRRAVGQQQAAHAALHAAATAVELVPEPGRGASRDGVAITGTNVVHLTDRTVLELEGFGRIVVLPGGADMAARRSVSRAADEALRAALSAAGAAEPADADRLARARQAAEVEAKAAESRRDSVLVASGVASAEALSDRITALVAATGQLDPGGDPSAVEARLQEAVTAAERAADRLETARVAIRSGERVLQEARTELALIEQELGGRQRAIDALEARLAETVSGQDDEALAGALAAAGDTWLGLLGERESLLRERAQVEPETTRERLAQAQRSIEALEADRRRLDLDIVMIESELRGGGDDGLGELLAQAEARLAQASEQLGRTSLEAKAWKLLHDELGAAAKATREALLAPIVSRLQPWLARLLPDVEPVLDPATLAPMQLKRGGAVEPLARLSHGTREQIAVLVRLGLAHLLKEREGEAPCLILDDALVYADETRFDTMKAILQIAARELQIIVLTCRPRDYRGLDGRHLRLEDCITRRLVDPAGAD